MVPQAEVGGRERGAGISGGDEGVGFAMLQQVDTYCHRIPGIFAAGLECQGHAFVFHGQHLGRVHDADGQVAGVLGREHRLDLGFVTHQDDFHAVFPGGQHGPGHVRDGVFIAAHGIDNNSRHKALL